MLTLDLLPARHGDALLLEYGSGSDRHRVLIDGGPSSTITRRALTAALSPLSSLDLLVVTHIDADHIAGVLDLLERGDLPEHVGDIWFNGWDHLPGNDKLGVVQGERLSAAIRGRGLPWNVAFGGGAVMVPDTGPLPTRALPGGLRLTVLSPTRQALENLRPAWQHEVWKAERAAAVEQRPAQPDKLGDKAFDPETLAETEFVADTSKTNNSSIAFLAEYEDRSVLLTGDAHSGTLVDGLRRLAAERGTPTVGALKVPHHGSEYNLSSELLDSLKCERFLFSTNGATYGHPDKVTIARIVVRDATSLLEFNYRAPAVEAWEAPWLRRQFDYEIRYGESDGHLRVVL